MPQPKTRDVLLLLARDLADHLFVPVFLVDVDGTLIFYNEPAGALLGQSFEEVGPLSADEWGTMWNPEDQDGTRIPPESLPLSVAFSQRRAGHAPMFITGLDGVKRQIEVTAFPLVGKGNKVVGAVAVFWEERRRKPR